MVNKYFEGQFPTKITFEDDSFDLTTVDFNKLGTFTTPSIKASTKEKFNATLLDPSGNLRQLNCEVDQIINGAVIGRWTEISQ
jgi:hypothetical protein